MIVPDKQQAFEFMAFWLGGTTAAEVGCLFGESRESIQRRVVSTYRNRFPEVLTACPKRKVTFFNDKATALKLSPCTMSEVMAVTGGLRVMGKAADQRPLIEVPFEDIIAYGDNEPADEHFRALYEAVARKRTVTLDYLSKRRHFSTVFSPHSFVRSPYRIHVRGWSQTQEGVAGKYMDLVPARIVKSRVSGMSGYVDDAGDVDWHRKVTVRAEMLPDLPKEVALALAQEYLQGQETHFLIRNVRQAVVRYVIEGIMNRRVGMHDGPLWSVSVDGGNYTRD